jgi:hypothetical protein
MSLTVDTSAPGDVARPVLYRLPSPEPPMIAPITFVLLPLASIGAFVLWGRSLQALLDAEPTIG